jgi:hypothetical protein
MTGVVVVDELETVQREVRLDDGDGAAVRAHHVGQAASRMRRTIPSTASTAPKKTPLCTLSSTRRPITRSGGERPASGKCAVHSARVPAAAHSPGATAPPTKAPSRVTQS